ncbi:MAG: carbohydrate kinase [Tannerella sp.]|jgi:fructokinase|nr:carbohydrate kinase [Tannerella sp.]
MRNNKPLIAGIGELLWDVFPDGRKAGGAPVNFVYHATCMGAEGCAVSAVGDDADGAEIVAELERNNIGNCIGKVDRPTGRVLVELQDGSPAYTIVEDVAWDYIPLTRTALDLVREADAVCFGTLAQRSPVSRATVKALLDVAPARALRLFDVNLRQNYYSADLIDESLRSANVLKVNGEELATLRSMFALGDNGGDDAACRFFIDKYSLRYLILTAGSISSTVYSHDGVSRIPSPAVKVADTVGAGDSFSGAFVYSILTGASVNEAHRQAVDTAAFVCTQQGAWPPYQNQNV